MLCLTKTSITVLCTISNTLAGPKLSAPILSWPHSYIPYGPSPISCKTALWGKVILKSFRIHTIIIKYYDRPQDWHYNVTPLGIAPHAPARAPRPPPHWIGLFTQTKLKSKCSNIAFIVMCQATCSNILEWAMYKLYEWNCSRSGSGTVQAQQIIYCSLANLQSFIVKSTIMYRPINLQSFVTNDLL